jgi:hypothetical protein
VCQGEDHEEFELLLPSNALLGSIWYKNHVDEVPIEAGEVQWQEESVEEQEEVMESMQVCQVEADQPQQVQGGRQLVELVVLEVLELPPDLVDRHQQWDLCQRMVQQVWEDSRMHSQPHIPRHISGRQRAFSHERVHREW